MGESQSGTIASNVLTSPPSLLIHVNVCRPKLFTCQCLHNIGCLLSLLSEFLPKLNGFIKMAKSQFDVYCGRVEKPFKINV